MEKGIKIKRQVNEKNYTTLQNRVRESMYRKQEIKGYTPKVKNI